MGCSIHLIYDINLYITLLFIGESCGLLEVGNWSYPLLLCWGPLPFSSAKLENGAQAEHSLLVLLLCLWPTDWSGEGIWELGSVPPLLGLCMNVCLWCSALVFRNEVIVNVEVCWRRPGSLRASSWHYMEPPGALFSLERTGSGGTIPGDNRDKTNKIIEMLTLLIFVLCVTVSLCVHIHMHVCMCVCAHVRVCVCMCECVSTYVCVCVG